MFGDGIKYICRFYWRSMIDVNNRQPLLLLIECLVAILEKRMAQAVEAICALFVYVCVSMFSETMMMFK